MNRSVSYRPLEGERHRDGRAPGDGVWVGAEDLGERGAVGARRLRVVDVLRVLEAYAEKDVAVTGLVAANAAGAAEGVDLQLEDSRREGLFVGGQTCLNVGTNVQKNTRRHHALLHNGSKRYHLKPRLYFELYLIFLILVNYFIKQPP